MKTILYNPVFINPQAYFVFPQLYNIEPNTEDYIEKAIYAGTLFIVSTDQNISRYYENTNEIDLSDFANKTIRISQYTDDGAVVLGEWQIGSNDIVIPKPIKDAMVCWYDPKKQGLTNEDIVTKYKIDFNTWNIFAVRGIATKTSKTFIITEIKEVGTNIIEKAPSGIPTENFTVKITGDYSKLKYRYITEQGNAVSYYFSKEGVYTLPKSFETTVVKYTGFQGLVLGTCNIKIEQLPTSILQDFSGNGNIGYCYNFAGEGSSGVGLYKCDTTIAKTHIGNTYSILTQNEAKLDVVGSNYVLYNYNKIIPYIASFKVKITGIPNEGTVYYQYNKGGILNRFAITTDGEYTVPESEAYNGEVQRDFVSFIIRNNIPISNYSGLTIKFIPDYPNQIVFDGIDDYIVCPNQPILTDYTVIVGRTIFKSSKTTCMASKSKGYAGNTGAFIFEIINANSISGNVYSFYGNNVVSIITDEISYQTTTNYNETSIKKGTASDTDELYIGNVRINDSRFFKGALRIFLLFNRTLTTDEITWVKKNLMGYVEPKINLFTSNNEIIQTVDGSTYDVEKKTILTYTGEQLENILDKINNEL